MITCENQGGGAGDQNLVAYSSPDGIPPYTTRVQGPDITTQLEQNPVDCGFAYVAYPRSGGSLVYVAYQDRSLNLNVVAFDMSAGSWGSPSATGINIPPGVSGFGLRNLGLVIHANGWLSVIYNAYSFPVFAITFNGSIWGSPVEIDDGSSPNFAFENVVTDGNGNAGILYYQGSAGGFGFRMGQKLYAIYNGSSVIFRGTASIPADFDTNTFQAPVYDPASNSVIFPLVESILVGFTFHRTISLLVGTPANAPVFTVSKIFQPVDVGADPLFNEIDSVAVTVNASGNRFDVYWFVFTGAHHFTVQHSTAPTRTGPWSAPDLYYDEDLNPPSPAPDFQGLQPIYTIIRPDGSLSVIVGLVKATADFFGVPYTWTPAAPLPPGPPGPGPPGPGVTALKLTVVMVGGFSPPTAAVVAAVGPVTLSGAGGVANTAVPSGNYSITGAPVVGYTGPVLSKTGGGSLVGSTLALGSGQQAVVTATYTSTTPGGDLTYIITGGALPPGLTLNPSTGLISGTPTAQGVFTYTVVVTDGTNTSAPVTCSILVVNCPNVL